jgi:hypothetical protein
VLIGTSRAKPILQGDFRQARRASGLGSLIWDRMKNDATWDIFVMSMWENQWTKNVVPLTNDLKDALYHESQGIVDIAVKLYAMTQIRAIALKKEMFGKSDFRDTAVECFWSVKPMLDALRSGDIKKIEAYGDIAPVSMDDYIMAYSAMLPPKSDIPQKRDEATLAVKAVLKLLELGVESALAKRLVGKVMAKNMDLRKVADVVRLAYQRFMSMSELSDPIDDDSPPDGDLRLIEGYVDMKSADIIEEKEW